MRRAGLLVLLMSLALVGCGGSADESADSGTEATTFAQPEPPDIDFAEYELPADNAEGDEWAREYLDLYERTYEHCDSSCGGRHGSDL